MKPFRWYINLPLIPENGLLKTTLVPQFLLKHLPAGLFGAAAVLLLLIGIVLAGSGGRGQSRLPAFSAISQAEDTRPDEKAPEPAFSRRAGQLQTAVRPSGKSAPPSSPQSRQFLPPERWSRLILACHSTALSLRPDWRPETVGLCMVLSRVLPVRAGPAAAA